MLTPDFQGQEMPLAKVIAERPDVFNHNVEVVPRLYPLARRGSEFARSCRVLRVAGEMGEGEVVTKSGLMVGLGETHEEMVETFGALREARRARAHRRAVPAPLRAPPAGRPLLAPRRVRRARAAAYALGFDHVAAGPLVRSSYHADQHVPAARRGRRAARRGRRLAATSTLLGQLDRRHILLAGHRQDIRVRRCQPSARSVERRRDEHESASEIGLRVRW